MFNTLFSNPTSIAIVMGCLIGVVISIAITLIICWTIVKINRDNNELKHSMLNKGMSAQEIEQVMNAGERSGKRGVRKVECSA